MKLYLHADFEFPASESGYRNLWSFNEFYINVLMFKQNRFSVSFDNLCPASEF